MLYVLNVLIGS